MDSEVAALLQAAHDRVRDAPDSHLQRRPVLDELRGVMPDLPADLVERFGFELVQGVLDRHEMRDAIHVQERISERPGHVRIDLGKDDVGRVDGAPHDVHGNAEAHESVIVGRTHLDERRVHAETPARDELRDLGQENGQEVGASFLDGGPHVRTDEKRHVPEAVLKSRRDVRGGPECHEVDDFVAPELRGVRHEGLDEAPRFAGAGADEDTAAGEDGAHRLLGRRDLAGVAGFPVGIKGHAVNLALPEDPATDAGESGRPC